MAKDQEARGKSLRLRNMKQATDTCKTPEIIDGNCQGNNGSSVRHKRKQAPRHIINGLHRMVVRSAIKTANTVRNEEHRMRYNNIEQEGDDYFFITQAHFNSDKCYRGKNGKNFNVEKNSKKIFAWKEMDPWINKQTDQKGFVQLINTGNWKVMLTDIAKGTMMCNKKIHVNQWRKLLLQDQKKPAKVSSARDPKVSLNSKLRVALKRILTVKLVGKLQVKLHKLVI